VIQAWHELSRPQVHGYDLVDVTFLDALKFVSIADEKVARVFEAPRGFVHVIKGLGVSELTSDGVRFPHCSLCHLSDCTSCQNERPLGASVPPLGLSNKALTDGQ
jgi:elongator complex protein 2